MCSTRAPRREPRRRGPVRQHGTPQDLVEPVWPTGRASASHVRYPPEPRSPIRSSALPARHRRACWRHSCRDARDARNTRVTGRIGRSPCRQSAIKSRLVCTACTCTATPADTIIEVNPPTASTEDSRVDAFNSARPRLGRNGHPLNGGRHGVVVESCSPQNPW